MYKKVKIAPEHIENHQKWVDLCIETANDAEGVDGVVINLTNALFLYDKRSNSDPALVKRNIQMKYAFSDLSNREWFRDERVPIDGPNSSKYSLEYHTLTEEFMLINPFVSEAHSDPK